jgi:hypothetical protein
MLPNEAGNLKAKYDDGYRCSADSTLVSGSKLIYHKLLLSEVGASD